MAEARVEIERISKILVLDGNGIRLESKKHTLKEVFEDIAAKKSKLLPRKVSWCISRIECTVGKGGDIVVSKKKFIVGSEEVCVAFLYKRSRSLRRSVDFSGVLQRWTQHLLK